MSIKKIVVLSLLAIFILGVCSIGYVAGRLYAAFDGEPVRLYIPAGTTEEALCDTLSSGLGEDFGRDVYFAWKLQRSDIGRAHGSYLVTAGDKALTVSRSLRSGRQTPVKVTFNNVRTLDALAERVADKMEWGSDAFLAACDSILPSKGFKRPQYIAAFLPDTYEFFWTSSPQQVVKRLSDIRDNFWNDERRAQASSLGLTPVGVATLASIVEEETAKSDERPVVARLYLNRLNRGMLLQADPTVKFALGDFGLKRIYNAHLNVDSPYNTYRYKGLPPGPIRLPERKTLEAVLSAPAHNYIYMCAKEDFSGYHNFASDLSSHNQNATRYHSALTQRNIR